MLNKVMLLGRLTKDPEVRYFQTQAGEPLASAKYTLAVDRDFKRDGEPSADFIQCTAMGKRAEFAEKFLTKGKLIAIAGRLVVRTWDDQNGQKHWTTEVQVEEHHFAESKASSESARSNMAQSAEQSYQSYNNPKPAAKPQQAKEPDGFYAIGETIDDDDLPF